MQFFETQSQGRLLNRFSKDIAIIDEMIPATTFDLVQGLFLLFGSSGFNCSLTSSSCRSVLSIHTCCLSFRRLHVL
jgi:ABC-type multidrug transport system fused ATPase/permease subunit